MNGRLAWGQLREIVVAHLRQHPGQEFSPTALGRALDRSAGAIANICGSSDPSTGPAIDETQLTETLVVLETEGLVMRMSPMKRRATASWRWAATTTEDESARSAKEPSAAPEPRQRLRAGELRGRVMAFMRAHSGEELSPTAVARALAASSGAVSDALERLVETGEVVRTQESPRRFATTAKRGERSGP